MPAQENIACKREKNDSHNVCYLFQNELYQKIPLLKIN